MDSEKIQCRIQDRTWKCSVNRIAGACGDRFFCIIYMAVAKLFDCISKRSMFLQNPFQSRKKLQHVRIRIKAVKLAVRAFKILFVLPSFESGCHTAGLIGKLKNVADFWDKLLTAAKRKHCRNKRSHLNIISARIPANKLAWILFGKGGYFVFLGKRNEQLFSLRLDYVFYLQFLFTMRSSNLPVAISM